MCPIVDSHCHIYPDKIAQRAVESIGKFYDIPMSNGGTVADMVRAEREAGVTHCIVFSVATKVAQVESINNFIASEVEKSNGFMTGLGTLHPDSPDMAADVEHLLSLGLKGVKLHPDIQGFKIDDYRCLKIYELCEKYGIPVLLHTGDNRYDFSNPNRVKPILETYTELTVIGAHLGGWSIWDKAVETLGCYKNFYVDCSSSLYAISSQKAAEVICAYGAERTMFATDYPMWSPKTELERFYALGLTKEEQEQILYKTASKLFGLSL
ncbi:MAG: amidohydrolase [Clostridia bacterium]|nr:amidohydrolase [Clostridia bacterium]